MEQKVPLYLNQFEKLFDSDISVALKAEYGHLGEGMYVKGECETQSCELYKKNQINKINQSSYELWKDLKLIKCQKCGGWVNPSMMIFAPQTQVFVELKYLEDQSKVMNLQLDTQDKYYQLNFDQNKLVQPTKYLNLRCSYVLKKSLPIESIDDILAKMTEQLILENQNNQKELFEQKFIKLFELGHSQFIVNLYKVKQNEKLVAIKEMVTKSLETQQQFLLEAKFAIIASSISQRNVIRTYEYYTFSEELSNQKYDNLLMDNMSQEQRQKIKSLIESHPEQNIHKVFLVMEVADCVLSNFLLDDNYKQFTLTPKDLFQGLKDIINVLEIMQRKLSISHRDIKPHNIFLVQDPLTKEMIFKLGDFGIIKKEKVDPITKIVTMIGTKVYMSPEKRIMCENALEFKVKADKNYSEFKADVFSLGITFLQVMTKSSIQLCNLQKSTLNGLIKKMDEMGKYDPIMKKIVKHMLSFEIGARPDFQELKQNIDNNKYK